MNTGFSANTPCSAYKDELRTRVGCIMALFMEKAIVIGTKYVKACGRSTLTSIDMMYALKYQAHNFVNDSNNDENLESKLNEYKIDIFTSESASDVENADTEEDESDTEEDESDTDEDESDTDEDELFTRCDNSNDPLIVEMNRIHDTWSEWHPTDRIQQLVKEAIDSTYDKINL